MQQIGQLQSDVEGIENAGYLTANSYSENKNAFGDMLWNWLHRYPVDYVPEDTSNNGWNNLGLCIIYYQTQNKIPNQPSQWGQLINVPATLGAENMQIWITQSAGEIYTRGSNNNNVLHETKWEKYTYTNT